MDAIVTAGGLNLPDDPLYELTGVEKKALIPLAGRPMIGWVVDALARSGSVEHIVVVGLKPDEVDFGDAPDPPNPTLLVSNRARHVIDPNIY